MQYILWISYSVSQWATRYFWINFESVYHIFNIFDCFSFRDILTITFSTLRIVWLNIQTLQCIRYISCILLMIGLLITGRRSALNRRAEDYLPCTVSIVPYSWSEAKCGGMSKYANFGRNWLQMIWAWKNRKKCVTREPWTDLAWSSPGLWILLGVRSWQGISNFNSQMYACWQNSQNSQVGLLHFEICWNAFQRNW